MTKEQIDKAVDEYIGYPREMDEGIETTMRRNAFKDGVDWRINSVWHKPEEVPEVDKNMLIKSVKGCKLLIITTRLSPYWDSIVANNQITSWAYVEDLIPTEDERNS